MTLCNVFSHWSLPLFLWVSYFYLFFSLMSLSRCSPILTFNILFVLPMYIFGQGQVINCSTGTGTIKSDIKLFLAFRFHKYICSIHKGADLSFCTWEHPLVSWIPRQPSGGWLPDVFRMYQDISQIFSSTCHHLGAVSYYVG